MAAWHLVVLSRPQGAQRRGSCRCLVRNLVGHEGREGSARLWVVPEGHGLAVLAKFELRAEHGHARHVAVATGHANKSQAFYMET